MQQLYLTGDDALSLADQLFSALNLRPAGYRLVPFTVGGAIRGEALHFLTAPASPIENDVPCRIRLGRNDWTIVPRALDEIAAPCIRQAASLHAPLLLGGITAQMLTCAAFREAAVFALTGPRPVIVAAADDAEETLRALTPEAEQLWLPVPQTGEGRAALLEELVAELALRL